MESTQNYPNLLSEKQAAKRLGIAHITLLRAREAGRIKFFRIGTRVLYSEEQLTEFLLVCERNGEEVGAQPETTPPIAKRKDNRVSSSKRVRQRVRPNKEITSIQVDEDSGQALLPFAAAR
jgi:excisionase family DNA binding protein